MSENVVALGDLAKDIVTGFTGVVISRVEHLNNCDRIGLQPRELKDNSVPDGVWFDEPQVELVEKAVVPYIPVDDMTINLGEHVKDTISGFDGIAIGVNRWLNGCIRIGVQPKKLNHGKPIDTEWFPQQQLSVVVPVVKEESPAPRKGGPMSAPKRLANPR